MALEQDIITRQINLLIRAILRTTELRQEGEDVDALSEVEDVLHTATGMDAQTLLKMEPSSFVMMLEVAQVPDSSAVWITGSLELQAQLHERSGNEQLASLRKQQADAVRQAFLVDETFDEIVASAQKAADENPDILDLK